MKMVALGVITDAVEEKCVGCENLIYIPQYRDITEFLVCKLCKQKLKIEEKRAWQKASKMIPTTRHDEFKIFIEMGISSPEFEQWFEQNAEAHKAYDIILNADFVTQKAFSTAFGPSSEEQVPW